MVFISLVDGGSYICIGILLNNGNLFKCQLFWLVVYCIEDQVIVVMLQIIWFYNIIQCYGDVLIINQSVIVLIGGVNILYCDVKCDILLLEFKCILLVGVFYQGWSVMLIVNGLFGYDIYYLCGDVKKYLQGNVLVVGVIYDGYIVLICVDWLLVVVEGGLFGLGLLIVVGDGFYQLCGGLYGGFLYCGVFILQCNDYFFDFSGVYLQIFCYFVF